MDEPQLDEKDLVRLLSAGRIALALFAWVAPTRFGRLWTGDPSTGATARFATRGLAARDIALGVGTLRALEDGEHVDRWLEAQVLADASDTASTLMAFRSLPPMRRWLSLATAGTACWLGVSLVSSFRDD